MTPWLSVKEGQALGGLRLVLTAGVPGPWSESAKACFHVKKLACPRIAQLGGQPNPELEAWTGETNAPQAVFEDEPARTHWSEIIFLAERLAPGPPLIPADPTDRALMFGLIHELGGESGFGWSKRLMLLAPLMQLDEGSPGRQSGELLATRYGYSEPAAAAAPARAAEVLALMSRQWQRQQAAGRNFLVGERLSALDLYWAAFSALVEPLPHEVCPMPPMLRAGYSQSHPLMEKALDPALLDHRQRIYDDWLELPIDLGPGFSP